MKKIKYLAIVIIFSGLLHSCLKDTPYMDLTNTQPLAEFSFGSPSKGIGILSFGTLPDTTAFDTVIAVNLASPQVLNYDVTVTVTVDTNLLNSYNKANPGNKLALIPDSACSGLKSTDLLIRAGYRIAKVPIHLHPTNIDPSVSFAIPLTITSVKGSNGANLLVSGNAGSIMYAFIGNPIAGAYTQEWIRWNNATGTGAPAFDQFGGATFTPNSPTEISVSSGTGTKYIVDFTNTGGVLGNFTVQFDPASVAAAGITITSGPTIVTADPINNVYDFTFHYKNAAGSPRVIHDKFTR